MMFSFKKINTWLQTSLIGRLLLFITFFVIISGVCGGWLISTQKLLFTYHFALYGGMGKVLLFGTILLCLLLKDDFKKIKVSPLQRSNWLCIFGSWLFLIPFFWSATGLLSGPTGINRWLLEIIAHLSLLAPVLLIFIALFPISFLVLFWKKYFKEVLTAGAIGIFFWLAMDKLFSFWPYLSKIVLNSVVWLLSFTHPHVVIVPPLTIRFPEFSITVGQYCSGIESLLLLSVLYIVIGVLDKKRLKLLRYIGLFIFLLIGMMLVNIVRVYIIIQAGFIFSPQIAAQFFHTYLGMILFLGYFLIIIKTLYPQTLQKNIN